MHGVDRSDNQATRFPLPFQCRYDFDGGGVQAVDERFAIGNRNSLGDDDILSKCEISVDISKRRNRNRLSLGTGEQDDHRDEEGAFQIHLTLLHGLAQQAQPSGDHIHDIVSKGTNPVQPSIINLTGAMPVGLFMNPANREQAVHLLN
jgi:hypothetical protein